MVWWCTMLVGAATVQPLPPNTGMSLITNVAGTTIANDAYWAEQCKTIPPSTLFLVLDMGAVRDFFKPTEGNTYCEMLQSNSKHQWSNNGVDWKEVDFYSGNSNDNGGSAKSFPTNNDKRDFLSFWGHGTLTGGCCSSSVTTSKTFPSLPGNGEAYSYGQPFAVSYAIHLQPQLAASGLSISQYKE